LAEDFSYLVYTWKCRDHQFTIKKDAFVKELRKLLPVLKRVHYLNYAATAPMLLSSAQTMQKLVLEATEPLQMHREQWFSHLEQARRKVAQLIGASVEEIAFVSSTSSGLSLIANAILWKEKDEVLYPADEFPSNRYVWDNLKSKGVIAKPIEPDSKLSFAEQLKKEDLSRVRLVAVSAVSYLDGRRHLIEEIVSICAPQGILVAVDAVQAVGAIPVDVHAWGCDFLACGGQKWLFGPIGSGFVYIKKSRLGELFTSQVGWASSKFLADFQRPELVFVEGARRFEPALFDIPAIAALATSIETLSQIGWEQIYSRIQKLISLAREGLEQLGYHPITPKNAAGILTILVPHLKLVEKKVIATHREGLLRISLHASADETDLAALFEALAEKKPAPKKPKTQTGRTLVTGASSGLGKAIAEELAKRGYSLYLIGRNEKALALLADDLKAKYGTVATPLVLDLSNPDSLKASFPDFDFLVNAAVSAEAELFSSTNPPEIRRDFETNFFAPVFLAQKIIQRGRGIILNIVTGGARCALPLFSSYSASKGAFWSWSESLQRETDGTEISVTTFLPPHMNSNTALQLGRKALAYFTLQKAEPTADPELVAKEAVDAALAKIPFVAPWKTRLRIALNALFPSFITRRILRHWKT
jgi:selenocysteine lyase/cysteine desulfurase/short-subunit dehydrogenase